MKHMNITESIPELARKKISILKQSQSGKTGRQVMT